MSSFSDPLTPAPPARAGTKLVDDWLAALADRHLANLRLSEVTRALRALSSSYVERRQGLERGAALQGAGKRAAFALFYGPLHFLTLQALAGALPALRRPLSRIVDLGCGTGVAGAALALASGGLAPVLGLDRHPWAVREARWTYRHLGLHGQARQSDLTRLPPVRAGGLVVAAYVLNELSPPARHRLEGQLLAQAREGGGVLVIEPIARRVAPWWAETAARVVAAGGRADEWHFPVDLPPPLHVLDRAAGLRHQALTARTLLVEP